MLVVVSRSAYATLLYTAYRVPMFVHVMSIMIDALSLWAPLQFFTFPSKAMLVKRLEIKKDWSLSLVLTLIVSSIFSMALYIAQKTQLPSFLLGHFDHVKNIMPMPLPLLVLGFIPTSYCVQELIYRHGFSAGAIAALSCSFIANSGRIALGIRGADLIGIFGVTQAWNAVLVIASAAIGSILQV